MIALSSLRENSRETKRMRHVLVGRNDRVARVFFRRNDPHISRHRLPRFVERYARRASTRDKLKRGFCSRALSLPRFPL